MIDQSTKRVLKDELLSLIEGVTYYYIKSNSIVDRVSYNGRNFYLKYKKIDEAPNATLLNQHLKREVKVAIPLNPNQIFIRYFGSEFDKFFYLLNRNLKSIEHKISLYQLDGEIDILIELNVDNSLKIRDLISKSLKEFIDVEWKILPDETLPESYNIFPLPYKIY
jgi:hypothetical protein